MTDPSLGPGTLDWGGFLIKPILTTPQTGGTMSITDTVAPPGFSPPRHIHHDADEIFVLTSGDCLFWTDGETRSRGPGEAVFVPRGTEHSFRVVSDIPCRHLTIFTPGGFEGFFAMMATEALAMPEDMARIIEIGSRFHVTFTGPPLAAP